MKTKLEGVRTTIAGGVLFLLPLILIIFLLGKGMKIAERLSRPIVQAIGVESVGGVALGTLIAVAALVLISFLAGLLARTRIGQATYSSLENSILGLLPQWRMARGVLGDFGGDGSSRVEVVLVPTDAGWGLGFVLEKPPGDWWTVYVPGSPEWTAGSVSYARSEQVHKTNLTSAEAILLLRRWGTGSAPIQALLASLEEKDAL